MSPENGMATTYSTFTRELACVGFGTEVHDDDYFYYELFSCGEDIDTYV